MKFDFEKCAMLIITRKRHNGRNRTAKSRKKKNRTLGGEETHKYLEILEADTIKQVEMEEKNLKKEYLWQRENLSKQSFPEGISSKE